MEPPEWNVVTGAFGYTGKYITQQLLSMGKRVRTLTGHPDRPHPFGDQVDIAPFNFDDPRELIKSLQGATTLYNTYWVRFSYGHTTFDMAVENTKTLIQAAEESGVRRIVHISITNPSQDSPFPYFRGKALLEKAIQNSRLSYAIVRPTVIFGPEGILINNIAWFLRRFPVFAIPGAGNYRLQPIFIQDVAQITVEAGQHDENVTIDAVGPEVYTFAELVRLIADVIGSQAKIVHLRPGLARFLSRWIGYLVNDIPLTRDELDALTANLLVSEQPPTGQTRLSDWLRENADRVGTQYISDLNKHYR